MDFARKQLEKYGWTDGKGLGKNENGIAEALKPKLKRSVTGVGHDAASDFTEHWWTQLYNKAAGNVEVEEKDGNTKKIKTKDTEDFEITNSTWKIQRKRKKRDKEEQYADYFVKKAVLTNGGRRLEKTENSASESEDDQVKKDVFNMTDEELFAACGGRTAHKGARHGLKATGKLARIAQQEHMLLTQSQYEGYSHAKRRKAEELSKTQEDNENETISSNIKQKKKKKKTEQAETEVLSLPIDCEKSNPDSVANDSEKNENSRKSKKLKNETLVVSEDDTSRAKKKKNKHKLEDIKSEGNIKPVEINVEDEFKEETVKKFKKKKLKSVDVVNE